MTCVETYLLLKKLLKTKKNWGLCLLIKNFDMGKKFQSFDYNANKTRIYIRRCTLYPRVRRGRSKGVIDIYCLLVRSLDRCRAVKMLVFGCLGRNNKLASNINKKTFSSGNFMYHRFLETAWLAPKESNINGYLISRQFKQRS